MRRTHSPSPTAACSLSACSRSSPCALLRTSGSDYKAGDDRHPDRRVRDRPVPDARQDLRLRRRVNVTYTLMVLAVSVFCLTSLDTATRLARYMFQEFWLKPGEKAGDATVTGARKVLCNPYVSTAITVVLGIALGMTGYAKIWPLFGAANQLLAGLGLLAVAAWLGKMGRNNKMFYLPDDLHDPRDTDVSGLHHQGPDRRPSSPAAPGLAWCYIRAYPGCPAGHPCHRPRCRGRQGDRRTNSKKAEQA